MEGWVIALIVLMAIIFAGIFAWLIWYIVWSTSTVKLNEQTYVIVPGSSPNNMIVTRLRPKSLTTSYTQAAVDNKVDGLITATITDPRTTADVVSNSIYNDSAFDVSGVSVEVITNINENAPKTAATFTVGFVTPVVNNGIGNLNTA